MLLLASQLIKEKYKEKNAIFSKNGHDETDTQSFRTYIDILYIIKCHAQNKGPKKNHFGSGIK
jgi:hypothetical protein